MARIIFALIACAVLLVGCETSTATPRATQSAIALAQTVAATVSATAADEVAATEPPRVEAHVIRVVDGDTLEVDIAGAQSTVRLLGANTPAAAQAAVPDECFGPEAMAATQALVERADGAVLLESDMTDRDDLGRSLRYVWLIHPDGQRMLNYELVAGGYARAQVFAPDVRYQDMIVGAEQDAQAFGRGLWGACEGFATPAPAPTPTSAPPTPTPTPRPQTAPPVAPPVSPSERSGVSPGAFCSPQGALGRTSTGRAMVCTTTATDSRARWRAR